jgi:hypothetical protein
VAKRLGPAGICFAPLEQGDTHRLAPPRRIGLGKAAQVRSANATSASLMLDWPGYEVRSGFAE